MELTFDGKEIAVKKEMTKDDPPVEKEVHPLPTIGRRLFSKVDGIRPGAKTDVPHIGCLKACTFPYRCP